MPESLDTRTERGWHSGLPRARLQSGYTKEGAKPLLRLLTGRPGVVEPPIGPPPDLSADPTARNRAGRRIGAAPPPQR